MKSTIEAVALLRTCLCLRFLLVCLHCYRSAVPAMDDGGGRRVSKLDCDSKLSVLLRVCYSSSGDLSHSPSRRDMFGRVTS